MKKIIANWGLYPRTECDVFEPTNYAEMASLITANNNIIARGNGRCYGDASLAKNVVSTLKLNSITGFDESTGIITCQAGVILSDILEAVVPRGFFLPITPGTKFITIGGALASDIHGKNHHVEGVFSDHVLATKLIDGTGQVTDVLPGTDLFNKTAGGLGATGIIVEVTFRLKKIETSYIKQSAIRAKNLTEIFALFEANTHYTYSVAWIDCLAKNNSLGRSVLLLGEHAAATDVPNGNALKVHKKPFLNIPVFFPSWFLNPLFIKLFNIVFYHKPSSSKKKALVHYDPYFYPLDKINNWNKIYGKNGFVQYQFVIPKEKSFEGVKKILEILSANNLGSFLAVLKLFGKSHDDRYLHFPIEGYTLALDIKISNKIWPILDEIDGIVTQLGGKIYLTKDARLSKKMFDAQYHNKVNSEKFMSNQAIRLQQQNKDVLLIIGANSDIAKEAAIAFIKKNPAGHLLLASRNVNQLQALISANGWQQQADALFYDAEDFSSAKAFVQSLPQKPTTVVYAAGILVENDECYTNPAKWVANAAVNYTGAIAVLNEIVSDNNPVLKKIIGISSIAGLRGRKSNFMYGSAKAGFHQYLFGLRQQLQPKGIIVQAITPGFVKTKMTSHLTAMKQANNAQEVGQLAVNNSKVFELYPSLFWRVISKVIKYAPEMVIKKL